MLRRVLYLLAFLAALLYLYFLVALAAGDRVPTVASRFPDHRTRDPEIALSSSTGEANSLGISTPQMMTMPRASSGAIAHMLRRERADSNPPKMQTHSSSTPLNNPNCGPILTRAALEESLKLGMRHLIRNQLPAGNFVYVFDWKDETTDFTHNKQDNLVRQAGAAWGLALIYRNTQDVSMLPAINKTLKYFEGLSQVIDTEIASRRVIHAEGESVGKLGVLALVALAHIDLLRSSPPLEQFRIQELGTHLRQYLTQIASAWDKDLGAFKGSYRRTGESTGSPSSYSDGESLLALVKAARHLGIVSYTLPTQSRPRLITFHSSNHNDDDDDGAMSLYSIAEAGHTLNVVEALRKSADSATTKGYYQWASMSWSELIAWGEDQDDDNVGGPPRMVRDAYGAWLVDLADWMIRVHGTLRRRRNTAYAYEGIVSAYGHLKKTGRQETEQAQKLLCTIQRGMRKLTSWQLGHSISVITDYIIPQPGDSVSRLHALGGVQNGVRVSDETILRIDVVQHQMHAVVLTLRHIFS